jgi:hypothetical protein
VHLTLATAVAAAATTAAAVAAAAATTAVATVPAAGTAAATASAGRLPGAAAVRAPAGRVGETARGIELLLSRGPREVDAAVAAMQDLIGRHGLVLPMAPAAPLS